MAYKPHILSVADGGTGGSSFGTTGQVFTSNGAGVPPTFQPAGGGSSPTTTLSIIDDFLQNRGNGVGLYNWEGGVSSMKTSTLSSGHPGIIIFTDISTDQAISLSDSTFCNFILGAGAISLNWVADLVALSTITDTYVMQIGMTDSGDSITATPNAGVYFTYTNAVNSGNWVMNCVDGGIVTSTNTSIPATTGFHNYGITINASGTSVSFTIDGVSAGAAITTNIPTTVISPWFCQLYLLGALPLTQIDLFYLTQTLTTPR